MTIINLPAYFFFWCGNASTGANYTNLKYILTALSLGNIGNSAYACNSA